MSKEQLQRQNAELQTRLEEAEETLRAIREGEVDAVVVSGTKGEQIFSLAGTDLIYRLIVETMNEAAFTVTFDGTILFCNAQFGGLIKRPMEQIVGHAFDEFVAPDHRRMAQSLLAAGQAGNSLKQRLVLRNSRGDWVPVHVASNVLRQPDGVSICMVASDLTELENSTELIQKLRRQQEALQAANEELGATEQEMRSPERGAHRLSRRTGSNAGAVPGPVRIRPGWIPRDRSGGNDSAGQPGGGGTPGPPRRRA